MLVAGRRAIGFRTFKGKTARACLMHHHALRVYDRIHDCEDSLTLMVLWVETAG